MIAAFNRFRRKTFIKNVAVLMSGTAVGQAISFAAAPVLTRLFDPTEFGLLGIFVATTAIVAVASTGRYELAIVLPREDEDAANVLALGCLLSLTTSLVLALVFLVAGDRINTWFGNSGMAALIWWLALAVFLSGSTAMWRFWATRRKRFKLQSVSAIAYSAGVAAVQFFAGLSGAGAIGLIGGNVSGNGIALSVLGSANLRNEWALFRRAVRFRHMWRAAREHYRFPAYSMPQVALNTASRNLVVFLLAYFFDPTVAGLYWFNRRLLQAPSSLIGQSVVRVFYQRAVEVDHNNGPLLPILTKATLGLAAVGICPAIVFSLFGPEIFDFVFGEVWRKAGVYSQWFVWAWVVAFVLSPCTSIVPILSMQGQFLIYSAVQLVVRACTIPLGAYFGDDLTAIQIYVGLSVVSQIMFIAYVSAAVGRRDAQCRGKPLGGAAKELPAD